MDEIIREIIDSGLIDFATDMQLAKDEIYNKDIHDAKQLQKSIRKMVSQDAELLDDYEATMMSALSRAQEIAYLMGVRNTVTYLRQIGVL